MPLIPADQLDRNRGWHMPLIPADQLDRNPGTKRRRTCEDQGGLSAENAPPSSTGPPIESPLTLSVPEAGRRYFGLSRNGSYALAAAGKIPTVRIGRLLRVPVRALEAMLDRATVA
jgi:hypothetical protein